MESAALTGSTMPWQAPSSGQPSSKSDRRRWWILTVFIAVLVVFGLVSWQNKWPGPPNIIETAVPAPVEDTLTKGPHPDDGVRKENESSLAKPIAKPGVDADSAMSSKPKQKVGFSAANTPETIPRKGASAKAVTKSPAVIPVTPAAEIQVSPSRTPYEKKGKPLENTMGAFQTNENAAVEKEAVSGKISEKEEEKNYREDSRIDLQALVWAPEPGSRFVLINNKMVREGGLVDNIVVEKINPDDVLLSEGANRWYVAFTVR